MNDALEGPNLPPAFRLGAVLSAAFALAGCHHVPKNVIGSATPSPKSAIGSATPLYTISDVGPVMAEAINNKDQIVGDHPAGVFPHDKDVPDWDDYYSHGFVWQNGAVKDLGPFDGYYSDASQINERGQILGFASVPGSGENGLRHEHICLWDKGRAKDLSTLAGYKITGNAGLTVTGEVYLTGYHDKVTTTQHIFLYNRGRMRDLGPFGNKDVFARGANSKGQIVGALITGKKDSFPASDTFPDGQALPMTHPVLWTDGRLHDLGLPTGFTSGEADAINDQGQIIGDFRGHAANHKGRGYIHAFLWQAGKFQDLGTLGGWDSFPYAINNKGQVVGFAEIAHKSVMHGFLWDHGAMRDINSLVSKGSHWIDLPDATGINDRGQIVGAAGVVGAHYFHSYLLTPK